jgi:hypothetical protein
MTGNFIPDRAVGQWVSASESCLCLIYKAIFLVFVFRIGGNQLSSSYTFAQSGVSEPSRPDLSGQTVELWLPSCQQLYNRF